MTPETIKYLCESDSDNQLQPGESIQDWYTRLKSVAINIAQNPKTSQESLAILARDSDNDVRWYVAQHLNVLSKTLMILAEVSDWEVRCYVAQNTNTSTETLAILAGDSDPGVRWCVAKTPNTPLETLTHLTIDPNNDIKIEAKKQLKQRNKI